MKTFCISIVLVVASPLLIGSLPLTAQSASPLTLARKVLSAVTNGELAHARSATAKYNDLEQAEAEGYVNFDLHESGKGFHYINDPYFYR